MGCQNPSCSVPSCKLLEASYNFCGYCKSFSLMSDPLIHAFFLGRATAEKLYEELETALTDAMSELGKFDAEQRERLRHFIEEVNERAKRAEEMAAQGRTSTAIVPIDSQSTDLQANIDELRAEIAQLRSELQNYRSRSA